MSRAVNVLRSAAGVTTWTVDADCLLVAVSTNAIGTISRDPSTTSTLYITPTANRVEESLVALLNSATKFHSNMNVELKKDEKLFIEHTGAGTISMYLENLPNAENFS